MGDRVGGRGVAGNPFRGMHAMMPGTAWAGAFLVLAQLQHPPPGMPDPYTGLTRPGTTVSCCGGRDCGCAMPCRTLHGSTGWMFNGTCLDLPEAARILPPPDFWRMVDCDLHVCATYINGMPHVVCWIGAEAS